MRTIRVWWIGITTLAVISGVLLGCGAPVGIDEFSLEASFLRCQGSVSVWCVDDSFVVDSIQYDATIDREKYPDSPLDTTLTLTDGLDRNLTLKLNFFPLQELPVKKGDRLHLRYLRYLEAYKNRVILVVENLAGDLLYFYYRVDGEDELLYKKIGDVEVNLQEQGVAKIAPGCGLKELAFRFRGVSGGEITLKAGEWGELKTQKATYQIRVFVASRRSDSSCTSGERGEIIYVLRRIR